MVIRKMMEEAKGNESLWRKFHNLARHGNQCSSKYLLEEAEEAIITKCVRNPVNLRYVDIKIKRESDESCQIWTLGMNEDSESEPLVLIHGMGAGIALWSLNLDGLSEEGRPLYAIDLPGFGKSSRPKFSSDALECEAEIVEMIEAWRVAMKIQRMILVGHSFGAYLTTSYSIKYPHRVCHLIAADPWGFNDQPSDLKDIKTIPAIHRMLVKMLGSFKPFEILRILGPAAPAILKHIRKDLIKNFEEDVDHAAYYISNYILHCNQFDTTGEEAFRTMMWSFGWAKHPMHKRLGDLEANLPLTVIYGSRSWVDHYPGTDIINKRPNSYVKFEVLDACHHVYAESNEEFNQIVLNACKHKNVTNKEY